MNDMNKPTGKWDVSYLRSFRSKMDPPADKAIDIVMSQGGVEAVNKLLAQLRENSQLEDLELPSDAEDLVRSISVLPDWKDPEKIETGQQVFAAHGPAISTLLMCKSLPATYCCAKGAMVLYRTGRLTERSGSLEPTNRRLIETAQFVVNVCIPGGLDPRGAGIVTAGKIRLIHASIRHYLKQAGWDSDTYGEPINQEDMAGTLQAFSSLILEGFKSLEITLTQKEIDGYYHCWHVIGYMLGLEEVLNPASAADGHELGSAILDDQSEGSKEGEVLTRVLIDYMEGILPGKLLDYVPKLLIRHFIGDKMADMLAIEDHKGLMDKVTTRLMGDYFHSVSELEDHSAVVKKIFSRFNMMLMRSMLYSFNDFKQVRFFIPPNLQADWNLSRF